MYLKDYLQDKTIWISYGLYSLYIFGLQFLTTAHMTYCGMNKNRIMSYTKINNEIRQLTTFLFMLTS